MVNLGVRNVVNIVQFLLAIIAAGLWGNLLISSKAQVIDLGIYGLTLISLLMVAGSFLDQEFKKYWLGLVAFLGLVFSVAAGGLLFDMASNFPKIYDGEIYNRAISAGVFAILLAIAYIVEMVFIFKS